MEKRFLKLNLGFLKILLWFLNTQYSEILTMGGDDHKLGGGGGGGGGGKNKIF